MQKYLSTTWRLWKLLKPFHARILIQLILVLLIAITDLYYTIFFGKIITSLSSNNVNEIFKTILFFSIFAVSYWTLDMARDYFYSVKIIRHIYQYLREFSLNKILSFNISQLNENNSMYSFSVISKGEEKSEIYINRLILQVIPTVLSVALTMYYLYRQHFLLATVLFLFSCIIMFLEYLYTKITRSERRRLTDLNHLQGKITAGIFSHLATIKSLSVSKKFIKDFLEKREKNMMENISFDKKRELYDGFRNYVVEFGNITLVFVGVYLYLNNKIELGIIVTVFWLSSSLLWKVKALQQHLSNSAFDYVEIEKYLSFVDMVPDFNEHGKYKFVDGDIEFENLSFKYPKGDNNVIEDLNIKIKKGQKVAFVGHSGSGKTTITKLLLRAYDYGNIDNKDKNKIESDKINSKNNSIKVNGVELKDINADSLRQAIGYVEQHVDLFDDTVKNNILLSVDEKTLRKWDSTSSKTMKNEKLTDDKLREIAKLARIDEFYHRLGDTKFDTEIGERGIKLSGGERQRIGIARAIIKEPAILIFDEATSALDTVNEKYIKEAIDNVSKGRTTIIIAHRLSTIIDSDVIFVFDKGRVVANGTHEELLENSKEYKHLIEAQELK